MDDKITKTDSKSPFKAALFSLLMGAGAGQIYNGQIFKGVVMILLFLVPVIVAANEMFNIYMRFLNKIMAGDLSVIAVMIDKITNNRVISSYSQFAIILWVISTIDAFYYAFLFNKKMKHELKDTKNEADSGLNENKNR